MRRVEILADTGRRLTLFDFAQTDGGQRPPRRRPSPSPLDGATTYPPAEFRGVRRASLLRALRDALPPGTVRSAARAEHVVRFGGGGGGGEWPAVEVQGGGRLEGAFVVGTDGAGPRSVVAGPKGLGLTPATYCGYAAHRCEGGWGPHCFCGPRKPPRTSLGAGPLHDRSVDSPPAPELP